MKRFLNFMVVLSTAFLITACGSNGDDEGNNQNFSDAFVNNGGAATNQTQNINQLRQFVSQEAFQQDIRGNTAVQIIHESAGTVTNSCSVFGIDFDCNSADVLDPEDRLYENIGGFETYEGRFMSKQAVKDYLLNKVLNPNLGNIQVNYYNLQMAPLYYGLSMAYGGRQDGKLIEIVHPNGETFYMSFDVPLQANPLWEVTFVFSGNGIAPRWNYMVDFTAQ